MYSKEEAFRIKQKFWTSFGQYMALQPSANGERVNWINYKTGVKDLYFRTEVNNKSASLYIEIAQKDLELQKQHYEKFKIFENVLHNYLGEVWVWNSQFYNEEGKLSRTIGITLEKVSVFREKDWSVILSFLKPRLLALDEFWQDNREVFL